MFYIVAGGAEVIFTAFDSVVLLNLVIRNTVFEADRVS